MQELIDGLYKLLFQFEVIRPEENAAAVVVFAVGCSIIGVLAVLADLSFFAIRGGSLLGLRHGLKNTLIFTMAWAIGALIIGYLGQIVNIFQVSLLACATVGVSWPILLTQIFEKTRAQQVYQEPTTEE